MQVIEPELGNRDAMKADGRWCSISALDQPPAVSSPMATAVCLQVDKRRAGGRSCHCGQSFTSDDVRTCDVTVGQPKHHIGSRRAVSPPNNSSQFSQAAPIVLRAPVPQGESAGTTSCRRDDASVACSSSQRILMADGDTAEPFRRPHTVCVSPISSAFQTYIHCLICRPPSPQTQPPPHHHPHQRKHPTDVAPQAASPNQQPQCLPPTPAASLPTRSA